MSKAQPIAPDIENLIDEVLNSRKYRSLNLPRETLRDLITRELAQGKPAKTALKETRTRLHNIVAPYLGDPDYEQAAQALDQAAAQARGGQADAVQQVCREILACHASTRERLPILQEFYARIFNHIGHCSSILDLACGLNPFALPWMGLPPGTSYRAYDLHAPRVRLINRFLQLQGFEPLAEVRDVLVSPPQEEADVAFLFKEAHRLEQRRKGSNLPLWRALRVRTLLVSLPPQSLSGRHDLVQKHRRLVSDILQGETWPVSELIFENEMVFCIEKPTALA